MAIDAMHEWVRRRMQQWRLRLVWPDGPPPAPPPNQKQVLAMLSGQERPQGDRGEASYGAADAAPINQTPRRRWQLPNEQQELQRQGWAQPPEREDGTLPLPRVAGLLEAEVAAQLQQYMRQEDAWAEPPRCGLCAACRQELEVAAEGDGEEDRRRQPCLANEALHWWEHRMGPVSFAAVALLAPLPRALLRRGARCGECCTCQQAGHEATTGEQVEARAQRRGPGQARRQHADSEGEEGDDEDWDKRCQIAAALRSGRLPDRLVPTAALMGWVPAQRRQRQAAQGMLQEVLLRQYRPHRRQLEAPVEDDGGHKRWRAAGGGHVGWSSEEDERWLPWIRHQQQQRERQQAAKQRQAGRPPAHRWRWRPPARETASAGPAAPGQCPQQPACVLRAGHRGRCALIKDAALLRRLRETAAFLGLPLHQLVGPWTCHSRLTGVTWGVRGGSGGEEEPMCAQPPDGSRATHECGAVNRPPRHCFECRRCGAPRWGGPLGEAQRRAAAALQQAGGLPHGTGDGRDTAALRLAARIAHEGGSAADLLPSLLRREEIEDLTQEQAAVVARLMEAQAALASGWAPVPPELGTWGRRLGGILAC